MSSENEPAKLLLPYLQRADELQKHEPLVAYYCRLYAMERGLRIPQSDRTKTTNSLLISLMKQLEKDKKSLKLGPEDNLHLEGFALNVFEKADKQDRAGRADLTTAKTFYAASIFFEILNQFGTLLPDVEQKQKYAVWKAADIRKALKEGRKPIPGPPGGGEDLSVPPSPPGCSYDVGTSATAVTGPGPDSDPSPSFHDNVNHYSTNVPPPPQFHDVNEQNSADFPPPPHHDFHPTPTVHRSESFPQSQPSDGYPSHDFHPPPPPNRSQSFSQSQPSDGYPSQDFHPPPPPNRLQSFPQSQPSDGYPSQDFHPPPPPNRSENSAYSPPYHQSFAQEPQQHLPHNYPNFSSYPSFTESSLPSVPTHYPSYYQGSETSYSSQMAPSPATSYTSTSQYTSSSRNGTISEPAPPSAEKYHYDSNYLPSPEKIAEAHKAARFAVGALAFDDVSVAVEHLKKSLELLTNPSAAGH